jgi:hypothetical protein
MVRIHLRSEVSASFLKLLDFLLKLDVLLAHQTLPTLQDTAIRHSCLNAKLLALDAQKHCHS